MQTAYDQFVVKVGYQGGSHIVVIPALVVRRLNLKKGDSVAFFRPEGKQRYRFYGPLLIKL